MLGICLASRICDLQVDWSDEFSGNHVEYDWTNIRLSIGVSSVITHTSEIPTLVLWVFCLCFTRQRQKSQLWTNSSAALCNKQLKWNKPQKTTKIGVRACVKATTITAAAKKKGPNWFDRSEREKESKVHSAKMDFTMKDFDCTAVNTAMNELLNVQNKKQFDIADVDNIDVKLEVINRNFVMKSMEITFGNRFVRSLVAFNNSLGR